MLIKRSTYYELMNQSNNEDLSAYYYDKGNFEMVSITENIRKKEYHIESIFRARYYKNAVKIVVNEFMEISSFKCDCPFCTDNSPCAHVGATLLYVMNLDQNTHLPYHDEPKKASQLKQEQEAQALMRKYQLQSDKRDTRQLIEHYQDKLNNEMLLVDHVKNIKIIAEITDHYYNSGFHNLRFKVGVDKFYIIKDLSEFLIRIDNEETTKYGKNLTMNHQIDNFDDSALIQIEFMRRLLIRVNDGFTIKELPLQNVILDDFFEVYSQLPYFDSKIYFNEEIGYINVDVEQIIDDNGVYYSVNLKMENHYDITHGKVHAYQVNSDEITRYQFDENGVCIDLLNRFAYRDELLMNQEDLNSFYKYVLYDVEDYINTEEICKYVEIVEATNICLYGDIDEFERLRLMINYEVNSKKGFGFKQNIQSLAIEKIERILGAYGAIYDNETHHAYLDTNNELTLNFVQEGLAKLKAWCEIFVSDAIVNLGKPRNIHLSVGVTVQHDLLNIKLDSLDVNKNEILNVLQSYRRKKKFHRLTNGVLLSLQSQELEELDGLLQRLNISDKELKNDTITLPSYRSFAIDDLLDKSSSLSVKREELFNSFVENFKKGENLETHIPEKYFPILRDYQREGVHWLHKINSYGFGGILADDMGLGKTLQIISYLEMIHQKGMHHLVICPASLLLNWQDELIKFDSKLSVLCLMGTSSMRSEYILRIPDTDVVITSYDYLRRDIHALKEIQFETIILDEAQYIKNQKTKNALFVKMLKGKHRFALTGTPIENSLAELWSIFDFLMPNYLYNYHFFQKNYEKAIVKEQDEEKQKTLKHLVEPFILRRNKQEVLLELPEKVENTYTIEFNEEEKNLYYANLMQVNSELQSKLGIDQVDKIKILAMLTRLRQICCEPRMIYDNIHGISSKLQGCMELIEALHRSHRKVLLFSSFTTALDLIEEELDKRGISHLSITGKTDKIKRKEYVDQFQNDDTSVFLISLKAGGTGLNLTAAEAVIHYDPWWNVSAQNQATDRAYRIGQTRNVQVFKLIMKDSIEEKIQELQMKKKNLADAFVEGNNGSISSMSMDDILDLLKE